MIMYVSCFGLPLCFRPWCFFLTNLTLYARLSLCRVRAESDLKLARRFSLVPGMRVPEGHIADFIEGLGPGM